VSLGAGKRRLFELLGPFLGLALVVIVFGSVEPSFLTSRNLSTVAVQTVITALGAIGMTFVIVSGGIDLSVGSLIALASVVTAWAVDRGASLPVALLAGVGAGGLGGALNGLIVTRARIVPFIATLGMMGVARGVAKWIAGEQTIHLASEEAAPFNALVRNSLSSPAVWITIALAVLMAGVLRATVFGTHTKAIGSNEDTARLCGVPVRRTKVWIYCVAGLFAGLAGVMLVGRLSVGDPTAALGLELEVIAAVVIGGASLSGGTGTILGSMVGALLMTALSTGCNLTGIPNFVQEILIGAIIVLAVTLDRLRHSRGE